MLYLIRHAQASYLSDHYDQLSDLGLEQAQALGDFLSAEVTIDQKYVGPHQRQRQTANSIQEAYKSANKALPSPTYLAQLKEHSGPATLHHHKTKLIQEDPRCIQWHNESLENVDKLRENSIKIFEHFIPQWMAGNYTKDGLEDFATFRTEIANGLDIILSNKQPSQNTILVTSAGSISAIMAELLEIDDTQQIAKLSFEVYNASVTSLYLDGEDWKIAKFNQVDHLSNEMKTVV